MEYSLLHFHIFLSIYLSGFLTVVAVFRKPNAIPLFQNSSHTNVQRRNK